VWLLTKRLKSKLPARSLFKLLEIKDAKPANYKLRELGQNHFSLYGASLKMKDPKSPQPKKKLWRWSSKPLKSTLYSVGEGLEIAGDSENAESETES